MMVHEHDMMSETRDSPNPNVGVLLEQNLLKQNHAEPVGKQRSVTDRFKWSEVGKQNWRTSRIYVEYIIWM